MMSILFVYLLVERWLTQQSLLHSICAVHSSADLASSHPIFSLMQTFGIGVMDRRDTSASRLRLKGKGYPVEVNRGHVLR